MSVVKLYEGVYKVISQDEELLNLMGLASNSTLLQKAMHIQKRSHPQELVKNLPLLTFYSPSGGRSMNNDEVYNALFIFDVYTKDDVDLAMRIAQRIQELFDNTIPSMNGVTTFAGRFEQGYESYVDIPNVYCFTVEIVLSMSMLN